MAAAKYDSNFLPHPAKEDWTGKFISFEGGPEFNCKFSSLYIVIRDDRSGSDVPHVHEFDELLTFVGLDPDHPDVLGGEVELCLGDELEKHVIRQSTTVFIPKGLKHLPIHFTKVVKPFVLAHIFLTKKYMKKE
jgi:hypothetical protein